jgi:Protein of unknown function (DUF742)
MTDSPPGPASAESSRLVRAYMVTSGRTHPKRDDLDRETLVSTTPHGEAAEPSLGLEQRSIVLLCVEERSIAEISTDLRRPLGVVKVLVDDMAVEGLVTVHPRATPGSTVA